MVGFRQPKTTQKFSLRHGRQEPLLLLLAAEGVNCPHGEARMGADCHTKCRVHALEFASDDSIRNMAEAGTSVSFECSAQETHLAEFAHDLRIEPLISVPLQDQGCQPILGEPAGTVADEALLLVELIAKEERVTPVKDVVVSQRLDTLENGGNTLTKADAHADKRIASALALELAGGSYGQPRAGRAQRVADCDRTTIWVHAAVVFGKPQAFYTGKDLGREGFVNLDDIHVIDCEPGAFQRLFGGGDWPEAHSARRHTCHCG